MLHGERNKVHVNIIVLHVDIIKIGCRGRSMPPYNPTNHVNGTSYTYTSSLFIAFACIELLSDYDTFINQNKQKNT